MSENNNLNINNFIEAIGIWSPILVFIPLLFDDNNLKIKYFLSLYGSGSLLITIALIALTYIESKPLDVAICVLLCFLFHLHIVQKSVATSYDVNYYILIALTFIFYVVAAYIRLHKINSFIPTMSEND